MAQTDSADLTGQLLPVISVLAGVLLTFAGTSFLEWRKWKREHRSELDRRSMEAFTDLLQTVTDIGRTLRQADEEFGQRSPLTTAALPLVTQIDQLVGRARRQATIARLLGTAALVPRIEEVEQELKPLHRNVVEAGRAFVSAGPADNIAEITGPLLVEPSSRLIELRDRMIAELRAASDK